jgi:hypothetical protein
VTTTKTAEERLATVRAHLHELDVRDHLDAARDRAEHLRDDVRDRAEHLRDDVRDRASGLKDDVQQRVPELIEDLEPASRQARIQAWEVFRRVVGALLVLPRLLVRLVQALPPVVEGAAEQGGELAARASHAAAAVPAVKQRRRRRRTQLAAWTVGGFAAGLLTGWLLARRRPTEVTFEATAGDADELSVPSVNGAAPLAADAPVRE